MKTWLQNCLPACLLAVMAAVPAWAAPEDWFGIQVVDARSGRGVPLVTLTTTNHLSFVSDSAGWIAFQEPGLMDTEVFFHVKAPGYSVPEDGFGYAGVRLRPSPGGRAEVRLQRQNVAERLYRVTGQGIYRHALLLGLPVPLPGAGEKAAVLGQDSVQCVPWKGRLFWLWGDTNVAAYPLGNFHCTCAWSDLPEHGGLDAAQGVQLEYLMEQGKVRRMLPMDAPGAVWLFGMLAVADASGTECLLGHYGRFESLDKRVEHGLARFDEALGHFVPVRQLGDEHPWQHPRGNAVRVSSGGRDYFYFTEDLALVRAPADPESLLNPGMYEALAWQPGEEKPVWQKKQPPTSQEQEAALVRAGKVMEAQAWLQLKDAGSGKPVRVHRCSLQWNAWRKRWIMIATQQAGDASFLGEVWYAEAPAPEGPWTKAVKVASHPRYSFYNPRLHPYFDEEGGRFIYFEGTYAETFSGNPVPVPGYDYNQLMYRLDLDDPRLSGLK